MDVVALEGDRSAGRLGVAGDQPRQSGFTCPDGPIIAVKVPGRAVSEMLSSSVLLPSIVHVTARTSRPPVAVAAPSRCGESECRPRTPGRRCRW